MRNQILRCIGCIIISSVLAPDGKAQCTFDVSADIEDLETTVIQIQVDDLTNPDLSAGQGICAVQLHFRHSYVGDLTIELVSPSGQRVQLIGGVTDLIAPTNLTTWNVRFLQCGFPAAPDAGFSSQWDNNQAWQVLTTYTGSYYPAQGCLEDFNLGSANGIWQLHITDHDAPQTGVLLGVTLVFCDNTGLDCKVCGVDAGDFTQPSVEICEGSSVSIAPVFADTVPDPGVYGYTFLVEGNNGPVVFSQNVSTTSLLPGFYTICGMSYSKEDSTELFELLDTLSLIEIRSRFENEQVAQCAGITPNCISVSVSAFIDPTFVNMEICSGESVMIGGQIFSVPGNYTIPIDVSGACDSVVVLNLDVITVQAIAVQQDTISCADPFTGLDGSGSVAGPGATYLWSTMNGTILSAPNQPSVSIEGGGTYQLIVSYQGCVDSVMLDVVGDDSFPFLFFEGGTITCDEPVFTFNTIVFPTGVQYSWTGPGGFSSSIAKPSVTVPGTYTLEITNAQNCSISTSAEVMIDTAVDASIYLAYVECQFSRAVLAALQGGAGNEYLWTNPMGETIAASNIIADISGQYCLEVTGANGCVETSCFDYLADYTFPDLSISAADDSLHCNGAVELSAISSDAEIDYHWTGPGGFMSGDSTVSITNPGQYIVLATGANQCQSRDTVQVFPGSDLPVYSTFTDSLDCLNDTVLIGIAVLDPVISYTWTGPGLVDTFTPFVRVTMPGIYRVNVVVQSGCILNIPLSVHGDYGTVFFTVNRDTVTCDDPVANLSFQAFANYEIIDWMLPDGSRVNQPLLNSTMAGEYSLTLIGENGCPRTEVFQVAADTMSPVFITDAPSLGCLDSVQLQVVLIDSVRTYAWTGPGAFSSSSAHPYVYSAGNYILSATGTNGCVSQRVVFVDLSEEFPSLSVTAETLDCIDSTALLSISSPDTVDYAWYANGTLLSDTATVEVHLAGTYVAEATGRQGCVTRDTVEVLPPEIPLILVQTDSVTCTDQAQLSAASNLPGADFLWMDVNGMTVGGAQITIADPGEVTLIVTGPNGCAADTTLVVGADTLPPVAIASTSEAVLCDKTHIHLDASGSVGDDLSYAWSTSDGIIEADRLTAAPLINGEGTYVVVVTETRNGCTDSDTIQIFKSESPLGQIFTTVIPECEGNRNGSIAIDSLPGASGPVQYLINGSPGGPLFENLASGLYVIELTDSLGCTIDTILVITNTSSMTSISLGEDKSILAGDTAIVEGMIDLDPSQIRRIWWEPGLSCDSCLANVVAPTETTVFRIFVEDVFGCIASDALTVFVDERGRVFVPNIFSPNGDSVNDEIRISAHPGVSRILEFSIYDRWGNAVYYAENFDREDASIAWDGTFAGKKLDPAVFVYILEAELITGRTEVFTGTITLIK